MVKITVRKYKDGAELEITGKLNINNIDILQKEFNDLIEKNSDLKIIGINCELLESIDSSGFGMLINISRQAEKTGAAFYVCELNTHVSALFDLSHLDKFFQITSISDFRKIVQL